MQHWSICTRNPKLLSVGITDMQCRDVRCISFNVFNHKNCTVCILCLQVQRLYGKYLRAESFRKALIYQKKYLLLLIGGFRDCEEETLAMIARMGAEPLSTNLTHGRLGPLSRFRSAARVIIAVWRSLVMFSLLLCAVQKTAGHLSFYFAFSCLDLYSLPSVLWRCWLGGRKGIRPVKKMSGGMLAWLSGMRCRLAYSPADATATHYLLLQ